MASSMVDVAGDAKRSLVANVRPAQASHSNVERRIVLEGNEILTLWPVSIVAAFLAAIFYMRMKARDERDRREPDTGLAILDFGRAYPDEAIRAIHATADEKAFFVRLHDGKAGFMLSQGNHFLCHLMEPGKISVSSSDGGRGLNVHFADFPYLDGIYEFPSAETAAEVSLWILGSFNPQSPFVPPETSH